MAAFMGLKLDIKRIYMDNMKKIANGALTKYGCVINDGDNLTKEDKARLRAESQIKYGLSEEEIAALPKPRPTAVKMYNIKNIMHSKSNLSIVEKIDHLLILQ